MNTKFDENKTKCSYKIGVSWKIRLLWINPFFWNIVLLYNINSFLSGVGLGSSAWLFAEIVHEPESNINYFAMNISLLQKYVLPISICNIKVFYPYILSSISAFCLKFAVFLGSNLWSCCTLQHWRGNWKFWIFLLLLFLLQFCLSFFKLFCIYFLKKTR